MVSERGKYSLLHVAPVFIHVTPNLLNCLYICRIFHTNILYTPYLPSENLSHAAFLCLGFHYVPYPTFCNLYMPHFTFQNLYTPHFAFHNLCTPHFVFHNLYTPNSALLKFAYGHPLTTHKFVLYHISMFTENIPLIFTYFPAIYRFRYILF